MYIKTVQKNCCMIKKWVYSLKEKPKTLSQRISQAQPKISDALAMVKGS